MTKVLGKLAGGIVFLGMLHIARAQLPDIPTGTISIELQPVVSGLDSPVDLVPVNDGSGRLYVVEQGGRIRMLENGVLAATPFLDLTGQVVSGGERGLLGLAFHPGFSDPASPGFRRFYTYSTQTPNGPADFVVPMAGTPDNRCVVTEWQTSTTDPLQVDLASRRDLLRIAHPQANHNGGKIAFRPSDGYLYIALGDGGAANDVGDGHTPNLGNGQDITNLLGKILRIDPLAPAQNPGSADPISQNGRYRIPASNPFRNSAGRDEIYAYGFRNPYRFSFDPVTDRLIVGDVGQGAIEEVDLVEAGRNYGWNRKEGSFLFNPANGSVAPDPNPSAAFVNPVLEYDHDDGISVIGGFVYRGSALPPLSGKYLFGDFFQPASGGGRLFHGDLDAGVLQALRLGGDPRAFNLRIKGFGTDTAGGIYVLADNASNTAGQLLKVVPISAVPALLNLSTRARVEADDEGLAIGGFIITGSTAKTMVLRGMGPSLMTNGQPVPGRLANPVLTLQDSSGTILATNDDWMTNAGAQEIVDLGLAPPVPAEAALIANLLPGAYTVTLRGSGGGTGIGLVELYDVERAAAANAVNLSTRARVQTGDNVVIGGIIIGGTEMQRVIARAIGPSLTGSGITAPLQNPTLELVNAAGTRLAFNDNWRAEQAAEIIATGVAPSAEAESALVANLAPGNYTAIVRSADGTMGVAVVEFYRLNPP